MSRSLAKDRFSFKIFTCVIETYSGHIVAKKRIKIHSVLEQSKVRLPDHVEVVAVHSDGDALRAPLAGASLRLGPHQVQQVRPVSLASCSSAAYGDGSLQRSEAGAVAADLEAGQETATAAAGLVTGSRSGNHSSSARELNVNKRNNY